MVFLNNNEDLAQAFGTIVDFDNLSSLYETFIDGSISGLGRTITIHLPPAVKQDSTSQAGNTANAYNPFFRQGVRPSNKTKVPGVIPQHRDIQYTAHVRVGPQDFDDVFGIGRLNDNEAMTTTVIESYDHILSARTATIDDLRYRLKEGPRRIGFSSQKYVMCKWERVNEKERP